MRARSGSSGGKAALSACAAMLTLIPAAAFAQATVDNSAASAAQIGVRLQGSGVTVSNATIPAANGSDTTTMYGLFSNGVAGAGLGIDTGAALSTGTISEMFTSNNRRNRSEGGTTTYSDADLTGIESGAIYNVAVVTMDVTLDAYATGVTFRYQFGSDEYPDYVGSTFNDLMAVLISGPGISGKENIATVPGGNTDINTVNIGTVGCQSTGAATILTNSSLYTRNGHTTSLPGSCNPANQPGPFPVVMEWNGLTTALTAARSSLTPGSTYQIKIAVADVLDEAYDSGLVIEQISATYGSDYGDAPASYGSPSHVVRSAHRLGAGVTRETGPYNDANAAADANDDGVTLPSFQRGTIVTIPVSVTGSGGYLQGFIDWDGDGSFSTAGDQIATDVQDGGAADFDGLANGVIQLRAVVPSDATLSQTFARFRWSTSTGLSATATANNGEVEDYALTISAEGATPTLQGCIGSSVSTHAFTTNPTAGTVATGVAAGAFASTISYSGFSSVAGTVGAAGVQYNFPSGGAGNPDAVQISYAVTPNSGSQVDKLVVCQSSYENVSGNNEPNELTLTWTGGGTATIYDPSNHITSHADGATISSGTTLTFADSLANGPGTNGGGLSGPDNWAVIIDAGGSTSAVSVTLNSQGCPASSSQSFCQLMSTSSNVSGERFQEWYSFDSVLALTPTATLIASKTVATATPGGFSLPGEDVVYTITSTNIGTGSADAGSIFIVDTLPAEVEFYNGDMDGGGPATGAVYFTQSGAGLTFSLATDVGYSNSGTRPASFAACTYAPSAGYDPNVKHLCVNPKGAMLSGDPDPTFSVQFRARIK